MTFSLFGYKQVNHMDDLYNLPDFIGPRPNKMKNKFILLLLIIVAFSCKKDNMNPGDGIDPNFGVAEIVDVSVELPAASTIDLSTTELYTMGTSDAVSASGETTAQINGGMSEVAWLFDSQDNLLLAGFITADKRTISTQSTAEVLAFFGMGTTFGSFKLKEQYVQNCGTFTGINTVTTAFEEAFLQDPFTLTNGSYIVAVSEAIASMTETITIDL